MPGLAEILDQPRKFEVEVAVLSARVEHIENDSPLLRFVQIGEQFAEWDASDQGIAFGDPKHGFLETQLLLQ